MDTEWILPPDADGTDNIYCEPLGPPPPYPDLHSSSVSAGLSLFPPPYEYSGPSTIPRLATDTAVLHAGNRTSSFNCDVAVRLHQEAVNVAFVADNTYDDPCTSEYQRRHRDFDADEQNVEESNTLPYVTVYACIVLWLFNVVFGLIAYVLSGKSTTPRFAFAMGSIVRYKRMQLL
jgi:hypothetical protein